MAYSHHFDSHVTRQVASCTRLTRPAFNTTGKSKKTYVSGKEAKLLFRRWAAFLCPPDPGALRTDFRNCPFLGKPLLRLHESADHVQRHRRRPGIQQQGIRKGRRTPSVIAQRLDEAAVLGDQGVDQRQFMHALDGNPVLAGQASNSPHRSRRCIHGGRGSARPG
jgi:hypothetical protein